MRTPPRSTGFSLIELLTAMGIFLVICAASFGLLTTAMKRYRWESQALSAFQEARFGLDQIVRDVNDAGYPPPNQFQTLPADPSLYAVTPVAWKPGYLTPAPCQITVNCTVPGDYDMILETKTDPLNPAAKVTWIRYQLAGTTLSRAVVDKTNGDPDAATQGQLVPYVQNVVNNINNLPAAQAAKIQTEYSTMFPGGNPVPIFKYMCSSAIGPQPCTDPGVTNSPKNVRSVSVTLIVLAPVPDLQTGRLRVVELQGRGRVLNPNQ